MSKYMDKVLQIINMVPAGKVVSYGQVALMAGTPRGARFVGGVLCFRGDNTPWWRVINNAGRISTTCLDHTATTQKEKLRAEGVEVSEKLKIDIERFRWRPEPDVLKKLELDEEYTQQIMEKYFF